MKTTRRRFIGYTAVLGAAAGISWLGYRRLNPRPPVTVNRAGLPPGHLLRDGKPFPPPQKTQSCNTLILGSGAAALSAAWYLAKQGHTDFLLAEGFERNGNNAGYYTARSAAPTGAHYLALPSQESIYVREMLADLGILQSGIASSNPVYRETDLVHAPQERLLYRNRWQEHLLPQNDADTRRFLALVRELKTARGSDGRKTFAIPIALSSQDPAWRRLDGETFARWLHRQGYRSPALLWYLDYCCRDDYGRGTAQVSAFAGLHYFAARGNTDDSVLTWPDGLARLSEALRRKAHLQAVERLPDAPELRFARPASYDASAVKITERGDHVEVWLRHNRSGATVVLRAKQVISAMPLMVAARIVENPSRYGFQTGIPQYAPWLVANFVLHRFPEEIGYSEPAWDNVVYGSPALGYVVATNQLIRTAKPEQTIFTAYRALDRDTPQNIRRLMLEASDETLLQLAAEDLLTAYGKRFWQSVRHVDITLRGHAMSVPETGYLSDPLLLALRRHRSRLVFAHSDLSGYSVFEEAAYWGVEAAKKVLMPV